MKNSQKSGKLEVIMVMPKAGKGKDGGGSRTLTEKVQTYIDICRSSEDEHCHKYLVSLLNKIGERHLGDTSSEMKHIDEMISKYLGRDAEDNTDGEKY